MKRLCVYCGSNAGKREDYVIAAESLASAMVERGLGLVYGGANRGIMGALANSMLALNGEVIGIIPEALIHKEVSHPNLTELHVVDSMHARKALMAEMSDGFIALPGGFGTLEELVEILTWAQLEFHYKPCGLLNVSGYYSSLLEFFDHASNEGFVREPHRQMVLTATTANALLDQFASYQPPIISKWTS